MSVSNTTSKAGPYSANGAQTVFPFAFKAFSKNDLRVVLTNLVAVESDLTVDSDFTVTLNPDQNASPGGSITTSATYVVGNLITIVINLSPTQLVSLTNFRPDVVEKAFDKLTLLVQQLFEQTSRSVKTAVSSTTTADSLLTSIAASVTAASNSATAASGFATSASGFATSASGFATLASGYATAASNSADAAANTPVAVPTHAAASKAVPVDADELPLVDSAAAFVLKKTTWLNIKAVLKTYFDSLYVSLSGAQTIGGVKTFSSQPIVPTQSMVRVNTANGYGSTNTKIRRFTNVVTNQGSDITYADSATLGASFTINTNGVYAISFSEQGAAATTVAVTLNTTQPTVDPTALTNASEVLAIGTTPQANYATCASGVFYLPAGSVVRAHTGGIAAGSTANENLFSITRVS